MSTNINNLDPVFGLDWTKMNGKIIAIAQDAATRQVLMVGVMTKRAFAKTLATGLVTFWSRSRKCLWTKGETSGNYLKVREIRVDCDCDSLLIMADSVGPTCHTGAESCFEEVDGQPKIYEVEEVR